MKKPPDLALKALFFAFVLVMVIMAAALWCAIFRDFGEGGTP